MQENDRIVVVEVMIPCCPVCGGARTCSHRKPPHEGDTLATRYLECRKCEVRTPTVYDEREVITLRPLVLSVSVSAHQ